MKIYFGYSSGVGKTYTMLKDAHEALLRRPEMILVDKIAHANTEEEKSGHALGIFHQEDYRADQSGLQLKLN